MSARRLAAALLATAAAVGAATSAIGHVPPGPAKPCPGGTDAVISDGPWSLIARPEGLDRIASHAASGIDGRTVLATDGQKLRRSTDGGCTWAEGYALSTPDVEQAPRIRMVDFPGGGEVAFMLVEGLGGSAGSQLLRSTDGGATFEPAGEGLPPVGGFRDIQGRGDRLYVVVSPRDEVADADTQGVTGMLYASEDGGRTFTDRSGGVPIASLALDPTDSSRLYVVRADGAVQRSEDGGASFAPLSITPADVPFLEGTLADPESALEGRAKWRRIAVGRVPGQPAQLALVASATRTSEPTRVALSTDDGEKFVDVPAEGLGPISGITFGNDARQILLTSGSDSTAQKGPGAQIFDIASRAFRDVDDEELLSLFEPRLVELSAGVRGHEGFVGVQMRQHYTGGDGQTGDKLARYILPDPPPELRVDELDRCLEQVAQGIEQPDGPPGVLGRKASPVVFEPGLLSLELEPGVPVRTPLKAKLAPVPTRIDVGFLFDTSTSMDSSITGVLCSVDQLSRSLRERGIDARFGIAGYSHRVTNRYTRHLDLTASARELRRTLAEMKLVGGEEEPMRSGLFQLATGAGLGPYPETDPRYTGGANLTPEVKVEPGQQLNYDPDREAVAMIVGDAAYDETTDREPTPEEVIGALNAKRIKTVGIQVLPDIFTVSSAQENAIAADRVRMRAQLDRFARETGTVAPAGGVDCDGQGQPDVAEGQPLVCSVRNERVDDSMGDTLVTLLRTFRRTSDVRLVPSRTSGLAVGVEGGEFKDVDVRRDSEVGGTAIVSCTSEQAGRRYELEFDVMVGKQKIGSLPGTATCGAIAAAAAAARPASRSAAAPDQTPDSPRESPAPAKKAPAPKAPAPTAAAPAPAAQPTPQSAVAISPPPPPPSPVPISSGATSSAVSASSSAASASASASASAPAANPGASPVVGMAGAEERAKAAQVATVKAGGGEHAMVAVRENARERSVLPTPAAITLGAGFVGAAGWLVLGAGRRRGPAAARLRRT